MSKSKNSIRRNYNKEFKEQALLMVKSGRSVSSVATSLGINEGLLYKWRRQYGENADGVSQNGNTESKKMNFQGEIRRLEAALRRVEEEREILKKALSIFSQVT
jgi:transposase